MRFQNVVVWGIVCLLWATTPPIHVHCVLDYDRLLRILARRVVVPSAASNGGLRDTVTFLRQPCTTIRPFRGALAPSPNSRPRLALVYGLHGIRVLSRGVCSGGQHVNEGLSAGPHARCTCVHRYLRSTNACSSSSSRAMLRKRVCHARKKIRRHGMVAAIRL